jgi:His-Xaa-Ser system radical SAM maturase HxsC
MLPLHSHARVRGVEGTIILKVLTPAEALTSDVDPSRCLIWQDSSEAAAPAGQWAGTVSPFEVTTQGGWARIVVDGIRAPGVVAPGDVIRLTEGTSRISVLYRRGSNSNTLFATERCNSHCLMCSQPPRDVDDRWLVDDMLATIPLVDKTEVQLGISGGEPTLLGDDLVAVLYQAKKHLPATELHILSNGRRFADEALARTVCSVRHPRLRWGIPVYAESPEIHDYIVQSKGAWGETLAGLYNLARHNASIEIRVVVQQANVERLGELAYFIFRNLAFVDHVAFMGLEPMGFARRNWQDLWIDPVDYQAQLRDAVFFLTNRGMPVSLYNFPLCTLPRDLWSFAPQSISDWKNVFLPECDNCSVRERCCGFFRTIGPAGISRAYGPIMKNDHGTSMETAEAQ